jgi:succinyl-CoA synthetase beta subunit
MNFEEHAAKSLILLPAGIGIPTGVLCTTPETTAAAVAQIGPSLIKAQVPVGKRGKAGGIKPADTGAEAERVARDILGMRIGGYAVERLLVEDRARIAHEFYAAVLHDVRTCKPLVLFSTEGGMDIEEIAHAKPETIWRFFVDIESTLEPADVLPLLHRLGLGAAEPQIAEILCRLYAAYRKCDAELIEINPLALLADGRVVALDCKFVLDDAAAYRQPGIACAAAEENLTDLERRAQQHQLKFIQLDGNVGVLANGAGLTMTTMDVIRHFGGRPANFLEIGGESYTKAAVALDLVVSNPAVKSLVINFCGAFARTDVMADGVVKAWRELQPSVPAFFSIHGTGEEEAAALVRHELGIVPFDMMEDAIEAAVRAAQ